MKEFNEEQFIFEVKKLGWTDEEIQDYVNGHNEINKSLIEMGLAPLPYFEFEIEVIPTQD